MMKVRYVCASTGEPVWLDGPDAWLGTALDLRRDVRSYALSHGGLRVARAAHEETAGSRFRTAEEADRALLAFAKDVDAGTPGTIVANGWSQRAYVVASAPTRVLRGVPALDLTFVLMDGVWRREELYHLFPESGDENGTKRYGYRYPYYYASDFGVRYVSVDGPGPVPWRMVIYGHVTAPQLTIAGNTHRFDVTVPEGGYLEVDSRGPDPSVTLVTEDGLRTDMFGCAVRGSDEAGWGEGCGLYAFERIPRGVSEVRWDDSFGFDLWVMHERGWVPYADGGQ